MQGRRRKKGIGTKLKSLLRDIRECKRLDNRSPTNLKKTTFEEGKFNLYLFLAVTIMTSKTFYISWFLP